MGAGFGLEDTFKDTGTAQEHEEWVRNEVGEISVELWARWVLSPEVTGMRPAAD